MDGLGVGCGLWKMRVRETVELRVLCEVSMAFKCKLCMREMHSAKHILRGVQMKRRHFVLILLQLYS